MKSISPLMAASMAADSFEAAARAFDVDLEMVAELEAKQAHAELAICRRNLAESREAFDAAKAALVAALAKV